MFSLCLNVESTGLLTGMTKNSPPRLLLHSKLGGLLSGPLETCGALHRMFENASQALRYSWPHLFNVCAYVPTVLTNPKPQQSASFLPSR